MNIFTGADVCGVLVEILNEVDDDSSLVVAGAIRCIAQNEAGLIALREAGALLFLISPTKHSRFWSCTTQNPS